MLTKSTENTLLKIMLVLTIVGAGVLLLVVRTNAAPPDPRPGNSQIAGLVRDLAAHNTTMLHEHYGDHLRDNLDSNLTLCTEVGMDGSIEGVEKLVARLLATGGLGVMVAGDGARAAIKAFGNAGLEFKLQAASATKLQFCYNGRDFQSIFGDDPPPTPAGTPPNVVAAPQDGAIGQEDRLAKLFEGGEEVGDALLKLAVDSGITASSMTDALDALLTLELNTDPRAIIRGLTCQTATPTPVPTPTPTPIPCGAGFDRLLDALPLKDTTKDLFRNSGDLIPSSVSDAIDMICGEPEPESIFDKICSLPPDEVVQVVTADNFKMENLYKATFLDGLLDTFNGELKKEIINLRQELQKFAVAEAVAKAELICTRVSSVFQFIKKVEINLVVGDPIKPFDSMPTLNCTL